MTAHVALGKTGQGNTYSYRIPEPLGDTVYPGVFVLVPFGPKIQLGVVIDKMDDDSTERLKEIFMVVTDIPPVPEKMCRFVRWVADYYLSPPGKVMSVAVPFFGGRALKFQYIVNENHAMLADLDNMEIRQIKDFCRQSSHSSKLSAEYRFYEKIGLLYRYPLLPPIDNAPALSLRTKTTNGSVAPAAASTAIPGTASGIDFSGRVSLTKEQKNVWGEVKDALNRQKFSRFLLFGVTGSGKTEIYLRAAAETINSGKSVLILLPEIGLMPRNMQLFTDFFKINVYVRHSKVRKSMTTANWFKINSGDAQIVIGTRSALFVPLNNIGLIVVDEEHDMSFKQQETDPHYSARDAAVKLAELHGAVYVAGSATPAIESYYNAVAGKFRLLTMKEKVFGQKTAEPKIINPRNQPSAYGIFYLSLELERALKQTYEKGEQSILFINRRGYARLLMCDPCKTPVFCANCSIPYTYSQKKARLECYYCRHHITPPNVCPTCKKNTLRQMGFGTERIESDIRRLFPKSAVARIDSETIQSEKAWSDAIKKIQNGDIDFIIGTQMITKGHDFPNVALVGILFPELGLNFPDFRAAERVFQLLVQASGRTGRRKEREDRVIVQSYSPEHPVIQYAAHADYESFYRYKTEIRRALNFPPFSRMALMVYDDDDEARTYNTVIMLRTLFDEKYKSTIEAFMGPIESPLYKLSNRFYWQWLIRKDSPGELVRLCKDIKETVSARRLKGRFRIVVDTIRG